MCSEDNKKPFNERPVYRQVYPRQFDYPPKVIDRTDYLWWPRFMSKYGGLEREALWRKIPGAHRFGILNRRLREAAAYTPRCAEWHLGEMDGYPTVRVRWTRDNGTSGELRLVAQLIDTSILLDTPMFPKSSGRKRRLVSVARGPQSETPENRQKDQ